MGDAPARGLSPESVAMRESKMVTPLMGDDKIMVEVQNAPASTIENGLQGVETSYHRAESFFLRVQRPCCPKEFPGYVPRHPQLQKLCGDHLVPDPTLPFWWTEGVVNSAQAKAQPWLRDLLTEVTWAEMMEGRVSDSKLKTARQAWAPEQRKLVASPKLGNMLNTLFIQEPREVLRYQDRDRQARSLPLWWYATALRSSSFSGFATCRFLTQTTIQEFTSGQFDGDRFQAYFGALKKRSAKNDSIESFLRHTFSEFPQVITRFNQRGSKASYAMRIAGDPYSIVTMSSRSPHWSSCQNPIQDDTHEMSHRLWANLLDPNMVLMEMIDPAIDEESNLVARAIVRLVCDQKRELLYLDCLYGERGYISSFVSLCRSLAKSIDLPPVSGRMIPFYTGINTSLKGYLTDFAGYEPPYLDFGQWGKSGHLTQFRGEGHLIVAAGTESRS